MQRSKGGMASPKHVILLFALLASCSAGPLGPLPNVTSVDLGLKEGSCALGDVVYMPGDEFPGASPCERCSCSDGSVQCSKQRCEPRPGCKTVHRPDHCCPTYQCECEQEGRVYDNGEKLVDPQDPCKVCYCQGGEVVCRRIACFVRDDCTPRLVPGRCCPEYDNCPLRGVTTLPGVSPAIPSTAAVENIGSSAPPSPPKENIKQEITIKEITPVSEIPVITDVKIKEILPSPSIEVAEYSSSKSPLITREATTEKSVNESSTKTEAPAVIETSSLPPVPELPSSSSNNLAETKSSNDPSKISLSSQDSINSEMYPPNIISIATMGSPSIVPDVAPIVLTTKAPVIEEEDLTPIEHNPLFPPIPDDLTVSSNHEDEIVQQEQNLDSEHGLDAHEVVSASSPPTSTEAAVKELLTTTIHFITDAVTSQDTSTELSTSKENVYTTELSKKTSSKDNSMINLRSAIPTEILNVPSLVTEDITEESEVSTDIPITEIGLIDSSPEVIIGTENFDTRQESNIVSDLNIEKDFITSTETDIPYSDATYKPDDDLDHVTSSQETQDQTTNFISKSNVATEITSQTELSSIPIETSDQKPHDTSEKILKDKTSTLTTNSAELDISTTKLLPISSEIITVSRGAPSENHYQSFENAETTEFILTSFGSSESATEPVELIKISTDTEKSSAIIDSKGRNNNVLTDLINLVGDVALISDHTESSEMEHPTTGRTTISDSEELLPVNVGYKSKNNNRNQNSITEVPFKSKAPIGNKQRVVEIEDDDSDNITDSPPPHDKVEPTTRRPIIDNVSDDVTGNKTEKSGKKDIEIITQSYVPTINRRPTKVVMKKSNEKPISEEVATESATVSSEASTANNVQLSSETTIAPVFNVSSSEVEERIVDEIENTTTLVL